VSVSDCQSTILPSSEPDTNNLSVARAHTNVIGWWVNDAAEPHPQTALVNAVHTGDVEKALNRFSVVGQQLVEFECVGVINN
jgi:hypothetical protein